MLEVFSTILGDIFKLPFETDLNFNLSLISQFFKLWWWVFIPFILFFPAKFFHLWWRSWEVWYKKQKWVFLEIKPPKEIVKPIKAMEHIFQSLWGPLFGQKDLAEMWVRGEMVDWASFEIASFAGEVHFYVRCFEERRVLIESAIYSQYPDAEISETEDYTKLVPQDIPNQEWDLYGLDLSFLKEDYYPIKTYLSFFEERGELIKEEKRIDPMAKLIETLSVLKPGEQYWLQIIIRSVSPQENPWVKKGKEKIDKIVGRVKAHPQLFGPPPEKKEEVLPPALRMTYGETEIVKEIENKIKKNGFETVLRGIYLAKRDIFHWHHKYIVEAYGSEFGSQNLNALKKWGKTKTTAIASPLLFGIRRMYIKKRKMFRNYIRRFPPFFPRSPRKGVLVLNTEELTTIYHFPEKSPAIVATRVEAKKGEPPLNLPTEE